MMMNHMMRNASPEKKRKFAAIFAALLTIGLVVFAAI